MPAAIAPPAHLPPPASVPADPPRRRRRRFEAVDRLNREWRRVDRDPAAVARARSWPIAPPGSFDCLDGLLALAGYDCSFDDAPGDRVLAALVLRARTDELAARVVLQRILPGVVSIAVRRGRIVRGGSAAAADELVATAWEVIRGFPIERRPERVAGNLLRDIEYRAFVRPGRRLRLEVWVADVEAELGEDHGVEDDLDPGAQVQWAQLLEWAQRRGVDAAHLDLLRWVAAGGTSVEIASALGCTTRTVRNRRRAALDEVRRAYADVAA